MVLLSDTECHIMLAYLTTTCINLTTTCINLTTTCINLTTTCINLTTTCINHWVPNSLSRCHTKSMAPLVCWYDMDFLDFFFFFWRGIFFLLLENNFFFFLLFSYFYFYEKSVSYQVKDGYGQARPSFF